MRRLSKSLSKPPDDVLQFAVLKKSSGRYLLGTSQILDAFMTLDTTNKYDPLLGVVNRISDTEFVSVVEGVEPCIVTTSHSIKYIESNTLIRTPFSLDVELVYKLKPIDVLKLVDLVVSSRFTVTTIQLLAIQAKLQTMAKSTKCTEIRVALKTVLGYTRLHHHDKESTTKAIAFLKVNYGNNLLSVLSTRKTMENPVATRIV